MRPGGGKSKGASFERDVCRRLSLWLSTGLRDDLLWRSAMSGGRATVQFDAGKINMTQSGDVTAIGLDAYKFCEVTFVEVKHYKNLDIARGFICDSGTLSKFWKTCYREAKKYNKAPLLIAKQNLYPVIAITDEVADVFSVRPIIVLNNWNANVYLFEEATAYIQPPMKRRSGI